MKKRVMVVDDSRVVVLQMKKLLSDSEYEVAAYCENGEEAIARYDEILPDVVTMDVIMPGLDGLETAQVILENHAEARIVMVSSLAYDDTVLGAKELGAKGSVFKPFERESLLNALDNALA